MIYLWSLHKKEYSTWFADRDKYNKAMKQLEDGYKQNFGDVKYLGGQIVDGAFPGNPDTFVVTTCLMVCKSKNINFLSDKDKISYSIDMLDGMEIGICRIEVNAVQNNVFQPIASKNRSVEEKPSVVYVAFGMGLGCGGVGCIIAAVIFLFAPNSIDYVVSYGILGIILLSIGLIIRWYYNKLLIELATEINIERTKEKECTIIDEKLKVYNKSAESLGILTELEIGTKLLIDFTNSFDRFYKARLTNGQIGYILKTSKVEKSTSTPNEATIPNKIKSETTLDICKAYNNGRCISQQTVKDTGPCSWQPEDWQNCGVVIEYKKYNGKW